ncbi:MAG: zf-HC2 domain-containing protein [bacterium]
MTCDIYRELVLAFVEGELEKGEAEKVEAHLSECPECSELVRELRGSLQVFRAVELRGSYPTLPESRVGRIAALGKERTPRLLRLRRMAAIIVLACLAGGGIFMGSSYWSDTDDREPAGTSGSIRFQSESVGAEISKETFILHSGNHQNNDSIDLKL